MGKAKSPRIETKMGLFFPAAILLIDFYLLPHKSSIAPFIIQTKSTPNHQILKFQKPLCVLCISKEVVQ